jgi:thiol-disulfide isomerase/thioredoxin
MKNLFRVAACTAGVVAILGLGPLRAHADWKDWAHERNSSSRTRTEVPQAILDKYGWELDYADGSGQVSFKELAESGQPFILVWWLSDCPVCHMQLPYVQKLQKQIEDNKLEVKLVSICIDQDAKQALKFVQQRGISFDVLLDPRGRRTNAKYRVKDLGTPVTYIFKSGGELADYLAGFKQNYSRDVLAKLGIAEPNSDK